MTVLHHIQQGHDAVGGEIDVLQLVAGLVQDVAKRHVNQFQVILQAPKVGLGQCGEQVILAGWRPFGHDTGLGNVRG